MLYIDRNFKQQTNSFMIENHQESASSSQQQWRKNQEIIPSPLKSLKQRNGISGAIHKLSLKCLKSLGMTQLPEQPRMQEEGSKLTGKQLRKTSKKVDYKKENPEQARIKQNQDTKQIDYSKTIIQDKIYKYLQIQKKDEENLLQDQLSKQITQNNQRIRSEIMDQVKNQNDNDNENQEMLLNELEISTEYHCFKSMPNLSEIKSIQPVQRKLKEKKFNIFQQIVKVQCKAHFDNDLARGKTRKNNGGKKMEIVCLDCKKILCAHCALFGNGKQQSHNKHKVLSLQQFIKNVKQVLDYCDSNYGINHIQQKGQKMYQRSQSDFMNEFSQSKFTATPTLKNKHLLFNYEANRKQIHSKISTIIKQVLEYEKLLNSQLAQHYNKLDCKLEEEQNKTKEMIKYIHNLKNQIMKLFHLDKTANCLSRMEKIVQLMYQSKNLYKMTLQQIILKVKPVSKIGEKVIPHISVLIQPKVSDLIKSCINLQIQQKEDKTQKSNSRPIQNANLSQQINQSAMKNNCSAKNYQQRREQKRQNRISDHNNKLEDSILSKAKSVDEFNKINVNNQIKRNFASPSRPTSNLLYCSKINQKEKKITHSSKPSNLANSLSQVQFSNLSIQSSVLIDQEEEKVPISSCILTLSNHNLTDQRLVTTLKKYLGSNKKQIKSLKLCYNLITDQGLSSVIDLLGNMTNLNLSNNLLSQKCLDIILKNKDKLSPLRLLNLRGNKFHKGVNTQSKVQALGKMGVVVCISD